MITDNAEQLRVYYENAVKQNPTNVEAVHYLAGFFPPALLLPRSFILPVTLRSLAFGSAFFSASKKIFWSFGHLTS
jgi:hypothetical protein